MVRTIRTSRKTIDYNRRKSSSESFAEESEEESSDSESFYSVEGEKSTLLEARKSGKGQLRQRRK